MENLKFRRRLFLRVRGKTRNVSRSTAKRKESDADRP
jgi:hypothetical protein